MTSFRRDPSDQQSRPEAGRRQRAAAGAGLALLVSLLSFGASAQEPDPKLLAFGKDLFQTKANCSYCHGWSADGVGDPHSPGNALSLRATSLTREQFREVVQCGRPGTAMPYFDNFAYRDKRCYGMTAAELGADAPTVGSATLQPREIDAVVDYLFATVVGRGPATMEECAEFWGSADANACKLWAERLKGM